MDRAKSKFKKQIIKLFSLRNLRRWAAFCGGIISEMLKAIVEVREALDKFLSFFMVVGISALVIWLLTLNFEGISQWLYPEDINRNAESLKILLTVIGGIFVILGLRISYLRARAMENNVKNQLISQVDERFKNAVEHLGSENDAIVFGGIAELVEIASKNSESYAKVIANIFCTFIRNKTSFRNPVETRQSAIVQYILDALFRKGYDNPFREIPLNLSKCDFFSTDLEGMTVQKVDFSFSAMPNFRNCRIENSNLEGTKFYRRTIRDCQFINCNFRKSKFLRCKLQKCMMIVQNGAMMQDAVFWKTTFVKNCQLECISLDLVGVSFLNCSIMGLFLLAKTILGCSFQECQFGAMKFDNEEVLFSNFNGTTFSLVPQASKFRQCQFLGAEIDSIFSFPDKSSDSTTKPMGNSIRDVLEQLDKNDSCHFGKYPIAFREDFLQESMMYESNILSFNEPHWDLNENSDSH